MFSRNVTLALLVAGGLVPEAAAQAVHFVRGTDTIRVFGETTLGAAYTIEAMVLREDGAGTGRLFGEQLHAQEDKQLYANATNTRGGVWNNNCDATGVGTGPLTTAAWEHIALVRTGGQYRFYVGGTLRDSAPATCAGRNATGSYMSTGAFWYTAQSLLHTSFTGYVDWMRISSVARYGGTFVPPTCEPASDASTLLLFLFNEAPGSTTVLDSGPSGFATSVGTGFPAATAPTFGPGLGGPDDTTACPANVADFSVIAPSAGATTYRWQWMAPAISAAWSDIVEGVNGDAGGGAGQPVFTATGVGAPSLAVQRDPGTPYTYSDFTGFGLRVIVSNDCGSVTSSQAAWTICHADYNCDGFMDGIDYDLFNNDFENPDPQEQMRADYNGDGFVDGIDYDQFNNDFEAGC